MYETTISKGTSGWKAETRIQIGTVAQGADPMHREGGERYLHITTDKALRGGIESDASVMLHTPTGGRVHAFGFGTKGDFAEKLMRGPERCTEKAVRAMHAAVLQTIEGVIARAKAHYAPKEAPKGWSEVEAGTEEQQAL